MWIPNEVLRVAPDAVDPCDEADVYCAYGAPHLAIRCLQTAVDAVGTVEAVEWTAPLDLPRLTAKIAAVKHEHPGWAQLEGELQLSTARRRRVVACCTAAVVLSVLLTLLHRA